jgi:hypothetical protein
MFDVIVKLPLPLWLQATPFDTAGTIDGPETLADWPNPSPAVVMTGLRADPSNPEALVNVTLPPLRSGKEPPAIPPPPAALLNACTVIAVLIGGENPLANATSPGPGTTLPNHVRGDSNAVDAIARMSAIIRSSPLFCLEAAEK